ncbi:hypothetical protein [Micromonospora sp. RTP1Z1]|uniref:hypothetical protein n=1 Tax=Micromonospora sp. RTP1Z1 TaxID=2994043 RepID=UPI0029C8EBD1|nr:hypothetical protein [Micromonospora sp. RTP1Z1]
MANIDVDQLKRVLSAEKTRADADAGRLRAVNRALRRVRPGPDFEARHRRAQPELAAVSSTAVRTLGK